MKTFGILFSDVQCTWRKGLIGCLVIVASLLSPHAMLAQGGPGGDGPTITPDYKKLPTPPSPNAAALGKFGDIPVSPSTGVPEISIPFYSYQDKTKNLNLNVSISYHAGGHKVEDMASNVGLGWALNAGGVIMRTMKGIPDDLPTYGYINSPPLPLFNTTEFDIMTEAGPSVSRNKGICMDNEPTYFLTVKQIAENTYDGEADIFNISVGSINEKFFFDKNKNVIFMSPNNLKVVPNSGASGSFTSFTVTDAMGVRYFFDIKEFTMTDNAIEPSLPAPPMYISSWYLSKILSADGKDEIQFQYGGAPELIYETGLAMNYKADYNNGTYSGTAVTYSYNYTQTLQAQRIGKILLPDKTIIDFAYTFNRTDYAGDKALTSIAISGNNAQKSFTFQYGYFTSDSCSIWGCGFPGSPNNWAQRLKLESVQESSGTLTIPPYTFEYNTAMALPYRNSKYQDWWGFYNGGAIGDIMPDMPEEAMLGYDRVPSLPHCKAWNLEKINYPTGGYTQFTYELNEGVSEGVAKPIGGLRVQMKQDYDPVTNSTLSTKYTYKNLNDSTSGILITVPSYTGYWNVLHEWNDTAPTGKHYYFNESLNPTQTLSYFNGSPVVYTRVKEEQFVSGANNGYKIYEFTPGYADLMHDNIYPYLQKQDLSWYRGLLSKSAVFNSAGDTVSTEVNEYTYISQDPLITAASTRNLITGNYYWDNKSTLNRYLFGARAYHLIRGKSQLAKTTKKEFNAAGQFLKSVTEFSYDGTYYLPTVTKTADSKGRTIEVRTYYPFNYNSSTYPILGNMVAANRVAETVSVEQWLLDGVNTGVKSITVNEFETVNTDLIKGTKTSVLETDKVIPLNEIGAFNPNNMKRSTAIKERVKIEAFDPRGRGVQFRYNKNETHSLIWGDHNEFPIASVANAAYADVAYTSFETTAKGNWEFTGTPTPDATSPTGKNVYATSAGISKNIDPGKRFTISLWRKGAISVTNASLSLVGKTVSDWTYEEYTVNSNASSVSIGGTGLVDELRLFPSGAQMTSYTYLKPSTVTSASDANGSITYYEYDALGRLTMIRDMDKNILKNVQYHYKGQ